jgi:hypothetical protein
MEELTHIGRDVYKGTAAAALLRPAATEVDEQVAGRSQVLLRPR